MKGYKHISIEDKKRVASMVEGGLSYRKVASYMGISKSSVCRIISQMRTGGTNRVTPRTGPKKKITSEQFLRCVNLFQRERNQTLSNLRAIIQRKYRVKYSRYGVHKYLKREGYKARVCRKKPFVSKSNRLRRIMFARNHKNWGFKEWSKVIWTDETTFELVRTRGKTFYYVNQSSPSDPIRRFTKQQGGGKIMLWGCFKGTKIGRCVILGGNMDARRYVNIISKHGMEAIDQFECGSNFIWMHDNAPAHNAKISKNAIKIFGWKLMNWPPNSPDLNPIENLWAIMKRRIYDGQYYASKDVLQDRIFQIWDDLDGDLVLENLIRSMPTRMKKVLEMNGAPIDY